MIESDVSAPRSLDEAYENVTAAVDRATLRVRDSLDWQLEVREAVSAIEDLLTTLREQKRSRQSPERRRQPRVEECSSADSAVRGLSKASAWFSDTE